MRGDIAVHRLLLDAAKEPAAPGKPYALKGRAALPEGATVSIQSDGVEQTTATVDAGGAFTATVTPVHHRELHRRGRRRVRAAGPGARARPQGQRGAARPHRSSPRSPPRSAGATVVLQLKLKERFGWWPVKVAKTNASGAVRFSIARGRKVQARVLLTASDEATELARSATFRLR